MADDENEMLNVAKDIHRYLETHPNAADTLQGITEWWVHRQRLRKTMQEVQLALEYLVGQGLVRKNHLMSGQVIYRNSKDVE